MLPWPGLIGFWNLGLVFFGHKRRTASAAAEQDSEEAGKQNLDVRVHVFVSKFLRFVCRLFLASCDCSYYRRCWNSCLAQPGFESSDRGTSCCCSDSGLESDRIGSCRCLQIIQELLWSNQDAVAPTWIQSLISYRYIMHFCRPLPSTYYLSFASSSHPFAPHPSASLSIL